jgi:hypothetical protein
MKSGDTVQISQRDGTQHWIYATVIQPGDAGAAVIVDHSGNREHGLQKFVPAAQIRTKADLQKDYDAYKADVAKGGPLSKGLGGAPKTDGYLRAEREHYQSQIDRLS